MTMQAVPASCSSEGAPVFLPWRGFVIFNLLSAVVFAGIQCQIHFEDFQEEKHKPGYIENLSEFLPEQYASSWGVEKKILKAYRMHQGLSPLDAKGLYIKTARDLPTYGVTFFLVKEKQKNKKKLVPRLLGINAESILRLDENTKEILQVWPLTQVKTYQVGKSETFTLNFGDYSDKEYSVKTQDAYRIRDILEGYIDLIRKRLLAGPDSMGSDGMVIIQDNVEASRGNIIHIVPNNPSKVVEQSFIGPSKLMPYANEMKSGEGTQIVTMHQMVVTDLANNSQQAVKGEVPMRSDMSMECVRRLNRLNSQTVTLVALLSDPNEHNVREAQKTVDTINTDVMPPLVDGLNKCAQKQSTEDGKKKMLDEIQELADYVQQLTDSMKVDDVKCDQAEQSAMKIANLTAQMYAEIDPRTKRRSDLLRKSRKSFIADEKMDSSLRRASFIAAAATALHTLDDAANTAAQPYQGPPLDKKQLEEIEKSAQDKIGKLNAAIALYLTAHTDPKIIDYSTAVNSMNTIKELMPELAKDAQALGSGRDKKSRQELLDGIRALCSSTRNICTLTGAEDHEKMQEASNKYADVSRKLLFTIGKGVDKAKETEIMKLAKTAADKANQLQKAGNEVCGKSKTPEAEGIHEAGAHVVNCAKDLLACAKIASPCPHEAHCRSALLAACSSTSAASRALLQRAAPLDCDKLQARADQLEHALQDIEQACYKLQDDDAKSKPTSPEEMLRLQIVRTIVGGNISQAADGQLNKPQTSILSEDVEKERLGLAMKIAQLNAMMASLVAARSDRTHPDHKAGMLAVKNIEDLMSEVTQDAKAISNSMDPSSRDQLLAQIGALNKATSDVCRAAKTGETQEVNDAVKRFSTASSKLVFTLSPTPDTSKGQHVVALSDAACAKVSQMSGRVQQLADQVGGPVADQLDTHRTQLEDKAQALLAAAQVTSPSISEPRCQSSLLSTVDGLSGSSQQLAQAWRQVPTTRNHQPLETELQELDKILEEIRKTCQSTPSQSIVTGIAVKQPMVSPHEVQRLRFVKTVSRAKKNLQAADSELDKPDICLLMKQEDAEKMQKQLEQKIEEVNAAVAALLAASEDRANPDYVKIEEAIGTISDLLPEVAKDSKTLSASMDPVSRDELLSRVRALSDASKDICTSADTGKGLETAASKFADASGRLVFTISPKTNTSNEQQVYDLSTAACGTTAEMLYNVKQLSQQVGGDAGQELDRKGAFVADNAQAILVASEKWAPTISEAGSRSKLLSAVDSLSATSQDLANTWRLMPKDSRHQTLEKQLLELEKIMGQLRGACHSAAADEVQKTAEVKRLKFVNSAAKAKDNLQAVNDELNKPVPSAALKLEDAVSTQHRLHQNIADLNAAIAALLAATADRSKPDYAAAEKSIDTINQLLPEVVKDAKGLSAGQEPSAREALLKQVRELCDVSRDVCACAETGQGLSESASKFADASGRLVFVMSPKTTASKEQQVLDLSAAACGTASQLLSNVQQLSQQVGGDGGQELDRKGARAADDAQALLGAVQKSASTISEPGSQKSILSSVDALSSSCQDVAESWRRTPAGSRNQTLERELQELGKVLGQLRGVCQSAAADEVQKAADVKRLKFVNSAAKAKDNLQAVNDELNKPVSSAPLKIDQVVSAQHRLHQNIADLNAAIAALLASTADRSKPDYATAEKSIDTINQLLPEVVKDAKSLSAGQEPSAREELLKQVRELCDVSRDVCACAETGQGLSESASKFADASGRLMFVMSPKTTASKEQQVLDLSAAACGTASQLLSNVQQLSQQVGGDAGQELDRKGARAADDAQALLGAAQKSASTILEPGSQKSILSSVDALSSSCQDVAESWRRTPAGSRNQTLERELQELGKVLGQLRGVCQSAAADEVQKAADVKRLKFVNSAAKAKGNLQAVNDELNKPVPSAPLKIDQVVSAQHRLHQNIADLNAAIAALLASTADRSKPDYATAEKSIDTINQLLPEVVKDAKSLSAGQEPSAREELLKQVRELCDVSRDVCACAETGQGLSESASKFADASGRLMFVMSPKTTASKEQQVLDLSAAACGTASQLLSNVQQLSQQVGGDAGQELDRTGARAADDAQALLATAQKSASTISEPGSQKSILSSVDALSSSCQDVAESWRRTPAGSRNQTLERELQELGKFLGQLRGVCQSAAADEVQKAADVKRLKFVNSAAKAKDNLQAVNDELNKPVSSAPLKIDQVVSAQHRLHQNIADLNAAIAALLASTADRSKPDYATAEKSIDTINQLLPEVVKDAKSLSAGQEPSAREELLKQVRELCDVSRDVCACVETGQGLSESALKFADASGRLMFVMSPTTTASKEQQVLDLSAAACGTASQLLSNVQQLSQQVGGNAGQELDRKGARAADDAQALLATAQKSASTISEPGSQKSILSSVDALSSSCQDVAESWRRTPAGSRNQTLERELQELGKFLGQLRGVCQSPAEHAVKDKPSPNDIQRIKFLKTVAAAKQNLAVADEELNKPASDKLLDQAAVMDAQHQLQQDLAQMSGAVAALLTSTADTSNPDYTTAEQSIGVVSLLLPQIIKDAKTLTPNQDPAGRQVLMERIRALRDASKELCASAETGQGLNEAASKYANASGKLVYVINPRVDVAKGQKVVDLSAVACGTASQLLSNVQQLSQQVGGDAGQELDRKGASVADNAQALLTVAQITAPSIADPHCQASTLSSVDALSSSSQLLAQAWRGLPPAAQQPLERELRDLENVLDQIRQVCKSAAEDAAKRKPAEIQRMKFIKSISGARKNLHSADEEFNKPVSDAPLRQEAVVEAQQQLQQKIALLNAAVGSLVVSTADISNPDYATAEQAMTNITELLPQVVKQSKSLSSVEEASERDALLKRARTLCDVTKELCATVETGRGLNEAASKYASASQELTYVVSPRTDNAKEQQLKNKVAAACGTASQLLSNVQQLSQQVGGDAVQELDRKGASVADNAQALLSTAQVTTPSISEPRCQSALISSADSLSTSSQDLARAWRQIPRTPHHDVMEKEHKELEQILSDLKMKCCVPSESQTSQLSKTKGRPEVPKRQLSTGVSGPTRPKVPPAVPKRQVRNSVDLTNEFLHKMRLEEDQLSDTTRSSAQGTSAVETDDEKHHQQFVKVVENASNTIGNAENDLMQLFDSKSHAPGPKLKPNQLVNKQKEMEQKLALANVEVAALVGANYADKIDYNTASKSIKELPQLLTGIVEDGKSLSNSFSDKARQAFLADMIQFCDKTRMLCDTAKNDRQKLKEAAIGFGDKSAKILYTVSSEADPDLEKQIISTAKEIGDSASRLAIVCSGVGECPEQTKCAAATIDSAGGLLYTAKLVAPAIHNSTCKEALLASAYKLSDNLKDFSDSWKPMASDPQHAKSVQELTQESKNLVQLLEHLRRSTRGQQVVEEKNETLVVENTPLRVLACKIHQDAQVLSEQPQLSVRERCELAQYCDKIRSALGDVDDAEIEARRTPQDINKHRELENAIQNLQIVILQNRPNRNDKERTKIVDLRDYIQDVVTESEKMLETANQLQSTRDKKALEHIKSECENMIVGASKLLDPKHFDGDTTVDDIFQIDTYGQECDSRLTDIQSNMHTLEDKANSALLPKYQALVESCNVLRFATKSGLSTAQSASLDAVLEDLHDLDTKVVQTLVDDEQEAVVTRRKGPPVPPKPWLKCRVQEAAQALCRSGAAPAPAASAPAAYVTDALARTQNEDQPEKDRLQKHLSKLIHLLKLLTVVTSKRVATWQPLNDPEVTAITDQIMQELEKPESGYGASESGQSILNMEDIKKLLTPNDNLKITGDKKQLQDRVQKVSSKLGMMSGNVLQSVSSPASLARSAHAAADAAVDLAATARALKDQKDPLQCKRIEEAAQEMSFATYNLLAMSEYVSQRPDHPGSRMKLLEALRQLNDSVNKLTRATCPANKLQQDCDELCRNLQVQQSTLQGAARSTCALPYADCVDALTSQQDVVDKLRKEESMSRAQFAKEMSYVSTAICNSTDYAAQCAYLVSISDQNKEAAKTGLVDTHKIHKSAAAVEDTCVSIMRTGHAENMQEEKHKLQKQVENLSELLQDSTARIQDDQLKRKVLESRSEVTSAADAVARAIGQAGCEDHKIRKLVMVLVSAVNKMESVVDDPSMQPQLSSVHPDTQARSNEILDHSRALISKSQALVKQVKSTPDGPDVMTWVTFKMGRDQVLDAFDALLKSIQVNGTRSGILEGSYDVVDEDSETANKSYVQVQLETANNWLRRPSCKPDTKMAGQQAVKNILDIGKKMCEDMKPGEKESTHQLVMEIDQLQSECSARYDQEKYSLLMERLKELKKIIERDMVTRVVEQLIEEEEPLADLDLIADTEKDETKRNYILERKIAELLAQLGKMTRVARIVADAGNGTPAVTNELKNCTNQSELLAPMLVKAAQERINKPNDKAVVDNYKSLLAKYAESLSRVRDLCDQAVDPMDFVQTAGVMMEQMREESSRHNDPHTCAKTSNVITKLANRVITVSMSSSTARRDPELQRALSDAKQKLKSVIPAPDTRASRLPDWRHTTAEILRTTGEVESVLGGENIFNKQPEPDQPIYSVALNLHASVREWSSRDNDIVAVARRMAVLMAKLSDHMNTDKQRELLSTSKQIVQESHEVAYLARKMAHECTDLRIKKNLLLACERIPTISTQLKMLTTVKGSSLGHQGTKEDKEAMNMLVDNAQSLMLSIQDVVKGAASASVKIMSQHGPRNRWVRRNYYY